MGITQFPLEARFPESVSSADECTRYVMTWLYELLAEIVESKSPGAAQFLATDASIPLRHGNDAIPALQAINVWFNLLKIAEENAFARKRRQSDRAAKRKHLKCTFANEMKQIAELGKSADDIREAARDGYVGPTLTAHPTEAKRISVLEIHKRISRRLEAITDPFLSTSEVDQAIDLLVADIEVLWLTGELRRKRPTPEEEVLWGAQFFKDSIIKATASISENYQRAWAEVFPEDGDVCEPRVRFHSWIGGDRDGNPHVTVKTTKFAVATYRKTAIKALHRAMVFAVRNLSISDSIAAVPEPYLKNLKGIIASSGDGETVAKRNSGERIRQALHAMTLRLAQNAGEEEGVAPYKSVAAFIDDLTTVEEALDAIGSERLARHYVHPIRYCAETFGFRTVTLDVRQNSDVVTRTLEAVWAAGNENKPVPVFGSTDWAKKLRDELAAPQLELPADAGFGDEASELLSLLRLMNSVQDSVDPQAIGPFILSTTRSAEDLFAVYLLAKYAGFVDGSDENQTIPLNVVPLFETIDDLRAAPEILQNLLSNPVVRRSVEAAGGRIEVMLGYSDSNKDDGFFFSSWELNKAQKAITAAVSSAGFEASFFHGRGGSVSRGGAPTGRAIAAQPAGTIRGSFRTTEQGEVVSTKYADAGMARYQLELLTSSVLAHKLKSEQEPELRHNAAFDEAMEALSNTSMGHYQALLNKPGFLEYFRQASPVEELARLKMGSRPARRFGADSLSDLRAIPWVFAWSQNRHMISSWYGFGTAIETLRETHGKVGEQMLADMFDQSRLFRLIVDEVEKSLYHTDPKIARNYASLVENNAARDAFWGEFSAEYERCCNAVFWLTGQSGLAIRFPAFRSSFLRNAPLLARTHELQVHLLHELHSQPNKAVSAVPLLQTMNCISTGLGWTG
ncbi:MAG: phosphoenolpyruvate carboxylase [Hyphomicrobiales bacterium]